MSRAPSDLILVRHGESTGNVAREHAEAAGLDVLAIQERDADVPLSELGRTQAEALGHWLAELPAARAPQLVCSSPYVRARDTAAIALATSGRANEIWSDERLRDRELGILDRLTARGVAQRWPDEAVRRRQLGKFYHRPPGGESFTDVVLRVRSFLADLEREMSEPPGGGGSRALIVAHDVVVLALRYVCEGFDEQRLLDVARTRTVGNAAVTRLIRDGGRGKWTLDLDNYEDHLLKHGSVPTEHEADHDVDPH